MFGLVLNNLMGITNSLNLIIAAKLIREDDRFVLFGNILFDHWQQCPTFDIGHYIHNGFSIALNHSHCDGFTCCSTPTLTGSLPPI